MHSFEADIFDLFWRNFQFRYKQVSHSFFRVFLNFFFNIEDSYVFASRVSFQLDISSFESFDILIEGLNVLDVFFYRFQCFRKSCF